MIMKLVTGLIVFGGYTGGISASVEVVSLSPANHTCPDVSSLPHGLGYFGAASVDGAPVLCGGVDNNVEYVSFSGFFFMCLGSASLSV